MLDKPAPVPVLRLELKPLDVLERIRTEPLLARADLILCLGPVHGPQLLKLGTACRVADGQPVFAEGQPGNGLFLVLKGEVALNRGAGGAAVEVGTARTGEFFGEAEMLDGGGIRTLSARAMEASEVVELPAVMLNPLRRQLPPLESLLRRVREGRARADADLCDFLDRW